MEEEDGMGWGGVERRRRRTGKVGTRSEEGGWGGLQKENASNHCGRLITNSHSM